LLKALVKSALAFVAIGLVLYAGVYYAAERLLFRTGDSNPFFKIATLEKPEVDWVILGASHAMPLDFGDFNAMMERETGVTIVNLAAPGTGPLYSRFVLEQFLHRHRTKNVLYVLDSFAFRSRTWNEDRFADAKLLARTPFDPSLLARLAAYCVKDGVDPRAVANYVTGFSKINNRDRFEPDIWEGETQFDRTHRPSRAADAKRIEYLFPDEPPNEVVFLRYVGELRELINVAKAHGVSVTGIKMPVPTPFHKLLPDEAAFDNAMIQLFAAEGATFHDFSLMMDEPRFYFDTDHLNRTGLIEFFHRHLKALFIPAEQPLPDAVTPLSSTADGRPAGQR
jgi:hypothetical protein